jgi:ribosome maturation factor RimP
MAGVAAELYDTIERTVEGLGYELVDVERLAAGLLRVTLDAHEGVKLEDCEKVSRQLSHLFAVENVDYDRLEVSSPGLDRPLKRARDFERFVGAEAQVQLAEAIPAAGASAGRKRLRGRLLEVSGPAGAEQIRMELTPDDPAPSRPGKGTGKAKKAVKAGRNVERVAVVVEFAVADVVKAKLVPEVNFRGTGTDGSAGVNPRGSNPGSKKQ